MTNIEINAPLKNNDLMQIVDMGQTCAYAVERITGDDTGCPVQHVYINIKTRSGKSVEVVIPNDARNEAIVMIDRKEV